MKDNLLGKSIQELREQMGVSQSCLASYLGRDQSYLSKIESGERAISVDTLEKLSELFGIPVEILAGKCGTPASLTCAFRKKDLTAEDLKTIGVINRIAMNMDFMQALLDGESR